jgi:hypothetical protein
MPLGLNGGLIGQPNSPSKVGLVSGVWTLDQVQINRLANLWPLDLSNEFSTIQTFTESGTFTVPQDVTSVEYLIVAGGGGGGGCNGCGGGGGPV